MVISLTVGILVIIGSNYPDVAAMSQATVYSGNLVLTKLNAVSPAAGKTQPA